MGFNQRVLKIVTLFLAVSLFCFLSVIGEAKKLPEVQALEEIQVYQSSLKGLVKTTDSFWCLDSANKRFLKLDTKSKDVVYYLPVDIDIPGGLAWDGYYFWVADNKYKVIHKIEPEYGQVKATLNIPLIESKATIEGLSWDGKHLWIATSAGFSSKLMQLDVKTGEVSKSLFADCLPRGLYSDGEYLWVVSYNLGKAPGAIIRFSISDDPVEMSLSREYICSLPGKEPTGISFDGKYFWVSDLEQNVLQKIQLPKY